MRVKNLHSKIHLVNNLQNSVIKSPELAIIKTGLLYEIIKLRANFPRLGNITLNPVENILDSKELQELIDNSNNEFSIEERGKDWAENADSGLNVREEGVKELLTLLNDNPSLSFSPDFIIADLLAGNGYFNQVTNSILGADKSPQFINSDISYFMFKDALKNGYFAVWQNAENPYWLKPNCVNAVLYAYGTHHIKNRLQAVQEGARILKKGGRLVIHDFEEGSAMAHWFGDIVSNYSKTRHDYPHFTTNEMLYLTNKAKLKNIETQYIDDPFIIVDETLEKALYSLAKYVIDLYGLIKFNGDIEQVLSLLEQYFGIHSRKINDSQFEAKIIRNALVCSATK